MKAKLRSFWYNFKYKYLGRFSYLEDLVYIGHQMNSAWLRYSTYFQISREFVFLLSNTHQVNIKIEPFLTYLMQDDFARNIFKKSIALYESTPSHLQKTLYFEVDMEGEITANFKVIK